MTKVSVIIPYHNVEQYLFKSLTSVVNQTLKDIEIICVNDASNDASKKIVQDFAKNDKRILMLNTNQLSGQSYCRNIGLEIASGEYISFVDADDWIEPDMLEKMYAKAKLGDTDITMCQARLYDDKTQEISTNDYYSLKVFEKFGDNVFNHYDTKDEILNINVVLWDKIYKKEFLDSISIKFAEGFIYEDLPFSYDVYINAKRVNILWESMYYYRQNRNFSTMQNSDKKIYDRIDMVALTYTIMQKLPYFQEKQVDIIGWLIDDIFHRYTLLEEKYYKEYYNRMRDMFINLNLTDEQKEGLRVSYCYDEYINVIENDYLGFWGFLIEKYKTANKRIKAAEHKCNLDIIAIKEYLEQYKQEAKEERDKIVEWWQNHYDEDVNHLSSICSKQEEDRVKQEYELKKWQAESVKQVSEQLTADYEWKLEQQKLHYSDALYNQKYYYENHYFLVKWSFKICKKFEQVKNKIKRMLKKN